MEEFVLYETRETQDTLHPYGEITSDEYSYRLVMLIKDNNVSFEYQCGRVGVYSQEEYIEYEETDVFDVEPDELDISEFDRISTYLQDLKFEQYHKTIKNAQENINRLIPTERG